MKPLDGGRGPTTPELLHKQVCMSQMWYGTQVIMMYVIYISGHKEHLSSSSYSDDATKIHVWLPSFWIVW